MFLLQAVEDGEIDKVFMLLKEKHCNINACDQYGRSCLHIAASHSRDDLVSLLVNHGADVNAIDVIGNTPLHYCGHVDTIEVLLNYGADAFARNKHGDQPITLMIRRGVDKDVMQYMRDLMDGEQVNEVEMPLIGSRLSQKRKLKQSAAHDFWYDFCTDLGPVRLAVLLVLILLLSLLVAYMVTGIATAMDNQTPIIIEQQSTPLEMK